MIILVKFSTTLKIYKSYEIFNTCVYFAEITKVLKQAIIHIINKSQYSVKLSLIPFIYLR